MEEANKINAYKCNKGHFTITINKDEGTTPFMIACPKCEGKPVLGSGSNDGFAYSRMYNVYQFLVPEYEWYKPSEKELKTLNPETRQHVNMGGLIRRKIARPAVDPKLKPSHTLLVDLLTERNVMMVPQANIGKYDQIILLAQSGGFDDYKFDTIIPDEWNWIGPKMALANIIAEKYPELSDIRQMVINGKFDDKMDQEDIRRMKRDAPKSMWKILGLE